MNAQLSIKNSDANLLVCGRDRSIPRLLGFIFLILSSVTFADSIFLAEVPDTQSPDITATSVKQLLSSSVSQLGHQIVDNNVKAQYSLRASLVRLAGTHILKVEKWQQGKMVFSSKLKAIDPTELDIVTDRVVRAVLAGRDVTSDSKVDEVTTAEVEVHKKKILNRTGALFSGGVGILNNFGSTGLALHLGLGKGFAFGTALNLGYKFNFTFDFFNRHSVNNKDVNLGSTWLLDARLVGTYFFIDNATSPFVGFDVGTGLAKPLAPASTSGGLLLCGSAGVALFRTHETHVEIGLTYTVMLETGFSNTPSLVLLSVFTSF